jgi:hypothetical protein
VIDREMGGAVASVKKLSKSESEAEAAFEKLANEVQGKGGEMMKPGIKAVKDFAAESASAFAKAKSEFTSMAKVADQELAKVAKAEANAAKGIGKGSYASGKRFQMRGSLGESLGTARGMLGVAGTIASPLVAGIGIAGRLAGDLARGAGVNLDATSYVQSYVQRQSLATDIAHSGYIPGAAGANGQRQNAQAIQGEAMAAATQWAQDPTKVLEGLQKFVAITGDLDTGRKIIGDMAKLTLATGANMEEVVDAAGEVSAKIGDIPDKAKVVDAVMRQIAGAGKMGAVEMRDFAAQLGKIAGLAPRFQGDVDKNIGEMGLLMQLARQKGGAGSAAQAATAVTQFAATLATPAKVKAYEALTGHSAYVDKNRTTLAGPESIILEALKASGGNLVQLGNVFSKSSARVVGGAANIFNQAGGGDQGAKAVADYFEDLRKATLSLADENQAATEKLGTAEAQAQRFNNELQKVSDEVTARLLPTLTEFGPSLAKAAGDAGEALIGLAPIISQAAEALSIFLGVSTHKPPPPAEDTVNDTVKLRKIAAEGGSLTPEEVKQFQTRKGELGQQVLDDRARLQKDKNESTFWGGLVAGLAHPFTSNRTLEAQAAGRVAGDEEKYKTDEENQRAFAAAFDDALRKHREQPQLVRIVNSPPVKADPSGRHPVSGP